MIDDATLVLRAAGHAAASTSAGPGRAGARSDHEACARPKARRLVGTIAAHRNRDSLHLDVTDLVDGSRTTLSLLLVSDGGRTVLASSERGRGPKIKIHGHTPEPTPTPTADRRRPIRRRPDAHADRRGGDVQPSLPIRAAFYYPWFPETWGPSSNPFTNYHPSLGWYDSSDVGVVSQHIAAMQYGGIQAGISSWWGQGSKTDQRVPTLLRGADGTDVPLDASTTSPRRRAIRSVAQLHDDLTYISSHYGSDPSFLRIDGRPVVFVYADGSDGCGMASRWAQANTVNAYIVLKVFPGYKTCADQPASWHQYGPASATSDMAPYSYTISPGFWKKGESTPRLTRDLRPLVEPGGGDGVVDRAVPADHDVQRMG